jgi:hypothetical protein
MALEALFEVLGHKSGGNGNGGGERRPKGKFKSLPTRSLFLSLSYKSSILLRQKPGCCIL